MRFPAAILDGIPGMNLVMAEMIILEDDFIRQCNNFAVIRQNFRHGPETAAIDFPIKFWSPPVGVNIDLKKFLLLLRQSACVMQELKIKLPPDFHPVKVIEVISITLPITFLQQRMISISFEIRYSCRMTLQSEVNPVSPQPESSINLCKPMHTDFRTGFTITAVEILHRPGSHSVDTTLFASDPGNY